MKKKDEIKVCLVGSSGGHLTHLYMLKPFWKDKNRFWVTFDKEDARSLLEGEKVYPCYFPTNRSIKALIKNTKIAWDVLHKEKPDLIISCGAAVAVPFFYIGKMIQFIQVLLEANGLAAGKDHQFKGRYDAEKNAVILTSGGPASFIMPLQIGKTPIVVPRQHQFNEHVNDHQVEFARNVAQRMGTIIPVEDINTLGDVIMNYDQIVAGMGHGMSSNNAKFNEELEKLVDELYCEENR